MKLEFYFVVVCVETIVHYELFSVHEGAKKKKTDVFFVDVACLTDFDWLDILFRFLRQPGRKYEMKEIKCDWDVP